MITAILWLEAAPPPAISPYQDDRNALNSYQIAGETSSKFQNKGERAEKREEGRGEGGSVSKFVAIIYMGPDRTQGPSSR